MKKDLLLLFFMSLSIISNCQTSDTSIESLRKYSYLIYGQKSTRIQNGTGFFIKHNGVLFFITARHVITGCRGDGKKIKFQPDTMYILNKVENTEYPIYVKDFYEKSICNAQHKELDVEIFEIDKTWDKNINIVNSFIDTPLFNYDKFVSWGYPQYNMIEGNEYDIMKEPINITGKTPNFWMTRPFADSANTKEDLFNFHLNYKNIPINTNMGGASGSPVFLWNIDKKKWQIIGILIGAPKPESIEKHFIIARIDTILENLRTK